jgi:hypothetical protein
MHSVFVLGIGEILGKVSRVEEYTESEWVTHSYPFYSQPHCQL